MGQVVFVVLLKVICSGKLLVMVFLFEDYQFKTNNSNLPIIFEVTK